MVNGVRMVFRKDRMLKRVRETGQMDMVGEKELTIMDNLDGQEVSTACWNRQVNGLPVYACIGKDGKTYEVHEDDCVAAM